MRSARIAVMLSFAGRLVLGQPAETPPKFEAADVHLSPPSKSLFVAVRNGPVHDGRYDVKTATMANLVSIAYGVTVDKVVGGPNWLELDRFDISAKVPPGTTPDSQKLMMQALLAERFKLVVHPDKRPLPAWALVAGKKPLLKEATGTEEPGCKVNASSRVEGGLTIRMGEAVAAAQGLPATLNLGPGGTIQYACRNMSMSNFAERLRAMAGQLGPNPILDETGLKGNWDFEIRWTYLVSPAMNAGERITPADAVEKQLGLKLEERQVPTPVIVVDSVNRTPGANPPGTEEAVPPLRIPTEFEVASIKPGAPPAGGRGGSFRLMPGGRLTAQNMALSFLVNRAFSDNFSDQVRGLPAFADTERFDVEAKSAALAAFGPADMAATVPALRTLLVDRFKMTWHTEEQQVEAYQLVQAKPKLKKADPDSRISCKNLPAPPGAPAGTSVMSCQNTTMAQFVERLQPYLGGLGSAGVSDATGLEGTWDFTLTWGGMNGGGRGGPDMGPGGAPAASDPSGGLTVFEALEKQLGLKLEKGKRTVPIVVIDHIEQKPTEN